MKRLLLSTALVAMSLGGEPDVPCVGTRGCLSVQIYSVPGCGGTDVSYLSIVASGSCAHSGTLDDKRELDPTGYASLTISDGILTGKTGCNYACTVCTLMDMSAGVAAPGVKVDGTCLTAPWAPDGSPVYARIYDMSPHCIPAEDAGCGTLEVFDNMGCAKSESFETIWADGQCHPGTDPRVSGNTGYQITFANGQFSGKGGCNYACTVCSLNDITTGVSNPLTDGSCITAPWGENGAAAGVRITDMTPPCLSEELENCVKMEMFLDTTCSQLRYTSYVLMDNSCRAPFPGQRSGKFNFVSGNNLAGKTDCNYACTVCDTPDITAGAPGGIIPSDGTCTVVPWGDRGAPVGVKFFYSYVPGPDYSAASTVASLLPATVVALLAAVYIL